VRESLCFSCLTFDLFLQGEKVEQDKSFVETLSLGLENVVKGQNRNTELPEP